MFAHVTVGTVARVVRDVVMTRRSVIARRTIAHVDAELTVGTGVSGIR